MRNHVQLITYVDRLTGRGIEALHTWLNDHIRGAIGGIHILPFFNPIDGTDAGFDPIDHRTVDPRLGTWNDIRRLGEDYAIMADLIVNHVSEHSEEFQDLLSKNTQSEYKDFFLTKKAVFNGTPLHQELSKIYRPRPGLPFSKKKYADGSEETFWTTFTTEQIDINVNSAYGKNYLQGILENYARCGIKLIRLDAAGYAIKRPGTSCFMIPETFDFIEELSHKAHQLGIEVLVEIHSHFQEQIKMAKKVDYVYDFALPPLILHALFEKTGKYLKNWFQISPKNAFTVLDTHDGIGVIDIGPEAGNSNRSGLIPDEEIEKLVNEINQRSNGQSANATGAAASNLDLYQVNCTYYDALGRNDDLYILARAIQFFAPGIPQVYYMGLLGEPNDMKLLEDTGIGRNINRHFFTDGEAAKTLVRPVVQRLLRLMKYRNTCPAFSGNFHVDLWGRTLIITWSNNPYLSTLKVDFESLTYMIIDQNGNQVKTLSF